VCKWRDGGQPKETAWLKVNQKAIESPRNQRKKRSKQSLQRRVKRALQRVGSRRSDRARRNRDKRLASAGHFIWCMHRLPSRSMVLEELPDVTPLAARHPHVCPCRLYRQGFVVWGGNSRLHFFLFFFRLRENPAAGRFQGYVLRTRQRQLILPVGQCVSHTGDAHLQALS
jgi:hypothetical protein